MTDTATYMPVADSGSVTITSMTLGDAGVGTTFAGSFTVTMQEVTIDDALLTTPVPGGCTGTLSHSWSNTIQPFGD